MEIVFSRSPHKLKRVLISAYTVEGSVGSVDYLNNVNRSHAEIGFLSVSEKFQGLGIARSLIGEMANDLGSGRIVRAVIIHDPTFEYLEGLNPRLTAAVNLSYTFSKREQIGDIPIVRIFESGGIHVLRVRVNYNSQDRRIRTRSAVNGATLVGQVL